MILFGLILLVVDAVNVCLALTGHLGNPAGIAFSGIAFAASVAYLATVIKRRG